MADITLTARLGETIDALIWREAGLGPGALPTVIAANRCIADEPALAMGQAVIIPESLIVSPAQSRTKPVTRIRLWS